MTRTPAAAATPRPATAAGLAWVNRHAPWASVARAEDTALVLAIEAQAHEQGMVHEDAHWKRLEAQARPADASEQPRSVIRQDDSMVVVRDTPQGPESFEVPAWAAQAIYHRDRPAVASEPEPYTDAYYRLAADELFGLGRPAVASEGLEDSSASLRRRTLAMEHHQARLMATGQEALGLLLAVDNACMDLETGEESVEGVLASLVEAADIARAALTMESPATARRREDDASSEKPNPGQPQGTGEAASDLDEGTSARVQPAGRSPILASDAGSVGALDVARQNVIDRLLDLNKFATWSALNRPEYPPLREALAEYVRVAAAYDAERQGEQE